MDQETNKCTAKLQWRTKLLSVLTIAFILSCNAVRNTGDWEVYGGGNERMQYSGLKEINTRNVKDLKVAWVYRTGDGTASGQIQANPLIAEGTIYGITPQLKLFAADASSGKEKWVFDPAGFAGPGSAAGKSYAINASRGLALYRGKNNEHLLFYTAGPYLYCINSLTGRPAVTFGQGGRIDLHDGLAEFRDVSELRVTSTTPGIIFKDLIIVGTSLNEQEEAAPGHIRAYNVRTGKQEWIFRTIPRPGERGYESWEDPEAYKYVGGANAWGGFSLDVKRGMVFASTGTSNPDFYGGMRKGNNLFANSVLAIDAASGKYIWHFQTIHHDVWDWDLPTAPVLVTVTKEHETVDAVVQVTKHGFIFMLNRETGEPLYPVIEKQVPAKSELHGESLSPTQPFPTFLPPFVRQSFTLADLNYDLPDTSVQDLKRRFSTFRGEGMFTPPSKQGTLVLPGLTGGAEWGGPSFDPGSGVLYINATEMPWVITVKDSEVEKAPSGPQTNLGAGMSLYNTNCAGCHGNDRKGGGSYPSLINIEKTYTETDFKELISTGRRMMPGFKNLAESEKTALAAYLLNITEKQDDKFERTKKRSIPFYDVPYKLQGIKRFLSAEGYPAISPPWGTLNAIDLNSGKILWKRPLGEVAELAEKGIHTGTENIGGSVTTAGDLIFIAATKDEKFRAFNRVTGELLFETRLPAAGYATPSVYRVKGKQYVVIACGGGKLNTRSGDSYVAFSLP